MLCKEKGEISLFLKLLLLFTLGPILEIYVLIEIGRFIGTVETIFVVIATGIIGAYLARSQGAGTLRRLKEELSFGEIPQEEILNGISILIGGILLVTPGLISDAVGFFLIIPQTRVPIKNYAKRKIKKMIEEGSINIWRR